MSNAPKPQENPPNRSAHNPRHNPSGHAGPQAERAEMIGNERDLKLPVLTSRQEGALPMIAFAPTSRSAPTPPEQKIPSPLEERDQIPS